MIQQIGSVTVFQHGDLIVSLRHILRLQNSENGQC